MTKSKARNRPAGRRYGRVQQRTSWWQDLPLLPIVVGAVLLVAAIVFIVIASRSGGSSTGQTINGIDCASNEQLAVHYHAHLSILVDGNPATLPGGIGIDNTAQCLYWLHTHATDGVIHIEAPKTSAARKFTLGDFFDVWKKRLDRTHVGDTTLSSSQKLVIFVDGRAYTGDPREVVLGKHTEVVLEVTPPQLPPPAFTFPSGE